MTTEPLWTGARLIEAMGARSQGPVPAAVTGASIDTRTLEPGDAFFAITGEARNGHDFVTAAFEKGAALAVVALTLTGCASSDPLGNEAGSGGEDTGSAGSVTVGSAAFAESEIIAYIYAGGA